VKFFVCLFLCSAISMLAQSAPKSITLTDTSDVPGKDILKAISKECPNISITNDAAKSDYTLEATKRKCGEGEIFGKSFYLTLLDRSHGRLSVSSPTKMLPREDSRM
jgi:hypothetical protein